MDNLTSEQEATTFSSNSPSSQSAVPLQPDLSAWKDLRVFGSQILALDAARLVPMGSVVAICFLVAQNADWIAYASVLAVTLGTMLAQKGSNDHASNRVQSTKDSAQPRNL